MSPGDRLVELWQKVDAFTTRVDARYPGALTCASGCSDCCRRELTVTTLEAAPISRLIAGLDAAERGRLADRAEHAAACVALDEHGRCAIYAARPVVCRSHGVPIRYLEPDRDEPPPAVTTTAKRAPRSSPKRKLPVAASSAIATPPTAAPDPLARRALPILDVCPRNFQSLDLETVDATCVLDQHTLSVLVGGLDTLHAREIGAPPGERRDLRAVIREAAAAPRAPDSRP